MRIRIALLALVAAMAGCDDDDTTAGVDASAAGLCSMALRGPGVHSIARYENGFLTQANAHVALRSHERGLAWHRLDGRGEGRIDLSAADAPRNADVALIGDDHALVSGVVGDFDYVNRIYQLSTGVVVYEGSGIRLRGTWLLDDAGDLVSLTTGTRIATACTTCELTAVDAWRAWLVDYDTSDVIAVRLDTGTISRPAVQPWTISDVHGGSLARGDDGWAYYGAPAAPLPCDGRFFVASSGLILCSSEAREQTELTLYDADFDVVGSHVIDLSGRGIRPFMGGFLVVGWDESVWLRAGEAPRTYAGGGSATGPGAVIYDDDGTTLTFLFADGTERGLSAPEAVRRATLSATGRRALVEVDGARLLYDLTTGEEVARLEARGWVRFAGDVLLHDGAPLGEAPSPNLANIAFPDPDCPAAVMEECVGTDCILAVVEFADD